jgi:hypothetical protein
MDVIKCASCGAAVNALAAGCPECGADPRTGAAKFSPPAAVTTARPQPLVSSIALGLAAAAAMLTFDVQMARVSVVLAPVAVVTGILGVVLSRMRDRPATRALLAIGIAAAVLVIDLWRLEVFVINY